MKEACHHSDPVAGILAHIRPRDLVLAGCLHAWRATVQFGGSVPDLLCLHVSDPFAMVSSPPARALCVRAALWESLVRPGLGSGRPRLRLGLAGRSRPWV